MHDTKPAARSPVLRRLWRIGRTVCDIYRDCFLSRSAAGLSYYLLLSLFPTVVCFSILLSRYPLESYPLLAEIAARISAELSALDGFTWQNPDGISSVTIFLAALTLLLSASAGAFRCLAVTTWEIYLRADSPAKFWTTGKPQSGMIGMFGIVFGYVFATVLFFAVYASIFLMILWEELIALLSQMIPVPALTALLSELRYPFLFLLFFAICLGLLRVLQPRHSRTAAGKVHTIVFPGALFCTVGLVAAAFYFSVVIRGSAKYSLVYGSLASMILFLMWIFICGNILLIGTAINAVLYHDRSSPLHF